MGPKGVSSAFLGDRPIRGISGPVLFISFLGLKYLTPCGFEPSTPRLRASPYHPMESKSSVYSGALTRLSYGPTDSFFRPIIGKSNPGPDKMSVYRDYRFGYLNWYCLC